MNSEDFFVMSWENQFLRESKNVKNESMEKIILDVDRYGYIAF